MATFKGTSGNDTITPGFVSPGVTIDPPGSIPSDADDTMYGYGGADYLDGGGGNDILNGGTGNDTMVGGTGDDTYYVDSLDDVVSEAADAGNDRINAYINYTLDDHVERLAIYGTATDGTGNSLDNILYGNTAANTLSGLAGNDSLYGYAGNDALFGGEGFDKLYWGDGDDYLDGGTGNDSMAGGTGNDTYVVDSAGDVVSEAVAAGIDRVNAFLNHTLRANYVERRHGQ